MTSTYLVVIPLFNHAASLPDVVDGVLRHDRDNVNGQKEAEGLSGAETSALLIVNDGSTDHCEDVLQQLCERHNKHCVKISIITHERNLGKGSAILNAAAWATARHFSHIITIDADGQHNPEDITALIQASGMQPEAVIVGARNFKTGKVPLASRFGRKFSWFWMRVQTGADVSDMQSGFRVYPLKIFQCLKISEPRFAFEIEVLVKASWAGFHILSAPVQVYYPPAAERISHFKIVYDNFRITVLNTKLTFRALLPVPFLQYEADRQGKISVLHPLTALKRLLDDKNTPLLMGFSTFMAVVVNTLPLIGLQSPLILLVIGWFRLNRAWTLAVHHALWTPFLIPLCIECGYFVRNKAFLTDISWSTLAQEAPSRILDWFLGSIVVAPLLGILCAGLIFCVALLTRRRSKNA